LIFSYYYRREIFTEVKKVTEKKISELLHANVSIDQINIGILNEISLSHFRIDERMKNSFFSFINVKKIVLQLNPLSYLLQPFRIPNTILMDSPNLEIKLPKGAGGAAVNWEPFFIWDNLALVIKDGRAQYDLEKFSQDILLDNINGSIRSKGEQSYELNFVADIDSIANGSVEVRGMVRRDMRDVNIRMLLKELVFDEGLWMPLRTLSGDVRLTKDTLYIDTLTIKFKNLPVEVNGVITDYLVEPRFDLTVKILNNSVRLQGGLPEKAVMIAADLFGSSYTVDGDFALDESGLRFSNLSTNIGYEVTADVNWDKHRCDVRISHETKEIKIGFFHSDSGSRVELDLNHVRLFGFDCVCKGDLALSLVEGQQHANAPIKADVTTDYFIFNYLPLKEFGGTCFIGREGIEDIDFAWGKVYNVKGRVGFDELNKSDLFLEVNGFDLERLSDFYSEQVRMDLKGKMQGRVAFKGTASNPDIKGQLFIADGALGELKYETAEINFEGNRFLLRLHDSIIKNKMRSFYVKGDIDFTQQNILRAVSVQTSERLVVWKGWDVATDDGQDGVTLSKQVSDKVTFNAMTLKGGETGDAQSQQVGLAYDYNDAQSLSLEAADNEDEELVQLKHKWRF
jgi:hypothetical protein